MMSLRLTNCVGRWVLLRMWSVVCACYNLPRLVVAARPVYKARSELICLTLVVQVCSNA